MCKNYNDIIENTRTEIGNIKYWSKKFKYLEEVKLTFQRDHNEIDLIPSYTSIQNLWNFATDISSRGFLFQDPNHKLFNTPEDWIDSYDEIKEIFDFVAEGEKLAFIRWLEGQVFQSKCMDKVKDILFEMIECIKNGENWNRYKKSDNYIKYQNEKETLNSLNHFSLKEVALYLNYAESYIYNLTSTGQIPHYKPTGGKLFFNKNEIDEWIKGNGGQQILSADEERLIAKDAINKLIKKD